MNALQDFAFEGSPIRVATRGDEHWFVATDVCKILGLENTTKALKGIPDKHTDTLTNIQGIADRRVQSLRIISKSGFYRLISRSTKPVAERFQEFVFDYLLPTLEKQGYIDMRPSAPAPMPAPYTPAPVDIIVRELEVIKEARLVKGPAYAADLWDQSALLPKARPAAAPARDPEAYACLRYMFAQPWEKSTVGELIKQLFRGRKSPELSLDKLKIEQVEDGFVVPNVHGPFVDLFKDTRWERPFEHLRRLGPDVKPHDPRGGRWARQGTFIPSHYLDEA